MARSSVEPSGRRRRALARKPRPRWANVSPKRRSDEGSGTRARVQADARRPPGGGSPGAGILAGPARVPAAQIPGRSGADVLPLPVKLLGETARWCGACTRFLEQAVDEGHSRRHDELTAVVSDLPVCGPRRRARRTSSFDSLVWVSRVPRARAADSEQAGARWWNARCMAPTAPVMEASMASPSSASGLAPEEGRVAFDLDQVDVAAGVDGRFFSRRPLAASPPRARGWCGGAASTTVEPPMSAIRSSARRVSFHAGETLTG